MMATQEAGNVRWLFHTQSAEEALREAAERLRRVICKTETNSALIGELDRISRGNDRIAA